MIFFILFIHFYLLYAFLCPMFIFVRLEASVKKDKTTKISDQTSIFSYGSASIYLLSTKGLCGACSYPGKWLLAVRGCVSLLKTTFVFFVLGFYESKYTFPSFYCSSLPFGAYYYGVLYFGWSLSSNSFKCISNSSRITASWFFWPLTSFFWDFSFASIEIILFASFSLFDKFLI